MNQWKAAIECPNYKKTHTNKLYNKLFLKIFQDLNILVYKCISKLIRGFLFIKTLLMCLKQLYLTRKTTKQPNKNKAEIVRSAHGMTVFVQKMPLSVQFYVTKIRLIKIVPT